MLKKSSKSVRNVIREHKTCFGLISTIRVDNISKPQHGDTANDLHVKGKKKKKKKLCSQVKNENDFNVNERTLY